MTKSELKREKILRSAIRCIGKFGLEHTNAAAIANDLRIAQSGIFYYFPKQEHLFDALLTYIAASNHRLVTELQESRKPKTHRERISVHIAGNLAWAEQNPDQVAALFINVAKTTYSREVRQMMTHIFQVGESRMKEYLAAGIAEGEFLIQGDLASLAAFLHKSLMGHIVSAHYLRGRSHPSSYFQELMEKHLDLLLIQSDRQSDRQSDWQSDWQSPKQKPRKRGRSAVYT